MTMARMLCFCLPAAVDNDTPPKLQQPRERGAAAPRRAIRWLRAHRIRRPWVACRRRRRRDRQDSSRFQDIPGADFGPKMKLAGATSAAFRFSYAELYIATNGFSQDEVLGSGGFGRVYRARLPSDNTLAAVKSVAGAKAGGADKTFAAELAAVAQLRHRNLVRLRGWCLHDAHLLLVYDYMPNRSLDRVLFAAGSLAWDRRRRIVTGLAAALFYLHDQLETQIVHRDVKSSNVMLDAGFNARLGDFGLARWVEHSSAGGGDAGVLSLRSSASVNNDSRFRLTETSRIGGTMGYLPPESFGRRGTATAKSDVFSFGIVLLEVATGRRTVDLSFPDDQIFMLDWVRRLSDEGSCLDAGDRHLRDGSFPLLEMQRLIRLGLLCTLHDPNARPTMRWVMEILSGANSGEIPTLPSFKFHPPYISLSSSSSTITTRTSFTTATFATARESTIYLTADNHVTGDEAHPSPPSPPPPPSLPSFDTSREISFKEILAITDNFSEARMVAELDFGTGYQGYLDNRYHVLVKRLGMRTCPALRARFSDELRNLGHLRHRHLTQLRGWCTEQGEMLVVYDYSPGDLLSHQLFHRRRGSNGRSLPWHHRYHIIKSLASAVLYLHEEWEEQVIHRSITSSAVYLDADVNPRLGSFALAEFLSRNEHGGHHAPAPARTSARGIFGYMAPEHMESGEATAAADVYSFGVVVLEIVSGEMAVDLRSPGGLLLRKVARFEGSGMPEASLADTRIAGEVEERELGRAVRLGIACTRYDPASRPSMKEIVSVLDGNDSLLAKFTGGMQMGVEEWDRRNAPARALVRNMQALGIY